MKTCSGCRKPRPEEEFYLRTDQPGKRKSRCKRCYKVTCSTYRKSELGVEARRTRDKSPEKKARRAAAHLRKRYNLTPQGRGRLELEQNGLCGICQLPQREGETGGRLHVDHDHTTGRVRGLLCGPCNRALGLIRDSQTWLAQAAAYLAERSPEAAPCASESAPQSPALESEQSEGSVQVGMPARP